MEAPYNGKTQSDNRPETPNPEDSKGRSMNYRIGIVSNIICIHHVTIVWQYAPTSCSNCLSVYLRASLQKKVALTVPLAMALNRDLKEDLAEAGLLLYYH